MHQLSIILPLLSPSSLYLYLSIYLSTFVSPSLKTQTPFISISLFQNNSVLDTWRKLQKSWPSSKPRKPRSSRLMSLRDKGNRAPTQSLASLMFARICFFFFRLIINVWMDHYSRLYIMDHIYKGSHWCFFHFGIYFWIAFSCSWVLLRYHFFYPSLPSLLFSNPHSHLHIFAS